MFKSVLPGVFIDQWRMQTEPALCGGRPFMVTLRGVAVQDDINWEKRLNIDVSFLVDSWNIGRNLDC